MGHKIIVDSDSLFQITKKIDDTSAEINNSIVALQKISNELTTIIQDKSINSFHTSFADYLLKLSSLITFYNSMSTTLNGLAKEYDDLDNKEATELKDFISN